MAWKWGDKLKSAFELVGITEDRAAKFLGEHCNCPKRREALNAFSDWAERLASRLMGAKEEHEKEIVKDQGLQELEVLMDRPPRSNK